ncbi:MAG: GIDE domain-containing protein [Terriglobales bacterium]
MPYFADILASAPMNLLALAAAGLACGLYLFYRGFRLLQRKRLILNTPHSKIRSASMGLVEINGLAIGPYAISSPLKQLSCYYYHSIAWEYQQRGKNSEWVKVAEESLHVPFYMDDGSGKLLVDPTGAEMDLHCDMKEEYNRSVLLSGPEMPGSVYTFLSRHGINSSRRIKVEERCISPNNPLFVLGTLSQNPGLDASVVPTWAGQTVRSNRGLASASPLANQKLEIVQLSGESTAVPTTEMTQQQKIAAALMKAGITNPGAWAAAGVGPEAAIRSGSSASSVAAVSSLSAEENGEEAKSNFDLHPPVVLMKGSHDPTFFISWRSQRDLIGTLGWKSTLMIWGGPALTLVCVYILLAHFNWL